MDFMVPFPQIVNALQQCIYYFDSYDSVREETLEIIHSLEHQQIGTADLLPTMCTCSIILYLTAGLFSPVCCYRLSSHGQLARLSLSEIKCLCLVKNFPRILILYCHWKTCMGKKAPKHTQYWLDLLLYSQAIATRLSNTSAYSKHAYLVSVISLCLFHRIVTLVTRIVFLQISDAVFQWNQSSLSLKGQNLYKKCLTSEYN